MFRVSVTRDEENGAIINFYARVASEKLWERIDGQVEEQIDKAVGKAVRELMDKPIKARITRELKKALGEETK